MGYKNGDKIWVVIETPDGGKVDVDQPVLGIYEKFGDAINRAREIVGFKPYAEDRIAKMVEMDKDFNRIDGNKIRVTCYIKIGESWSRVQ